MTAMTDEGADKSKVSRPARGWKFRHLGALALAAALVAVFYWLRPEWSPMHRWNRAFGDASFVLVAVVMSIGPLSRLWRKGATLLPWRRELGIWAFVAGLVHGGFILFGWVDLEWQRLFGLAFHPQFSQYVMFEKGFGLANVIGIVALIYGLLLALLSNDLSQRWLGMSVWKYLQQGAYILWVLVLSHTAYFLYMHFLSYHRPPAEPNFLQWPFVWVVLFVFLLQSVASWRTWKLGSQRRPQNG